jgi:hypothetical protein
MLCRVQEIVEWPAPATAITVSPAGAHATKEPSSAPQLLQQRLGLAAASIRRDRQFEHHHVGKFDAVIFNFRRSAGRAEVPLLAHDLLERVSRAGRPAQYELLSALQAVLNLGVCRYAGKVQGEVNLLRR